MGIHTLPAFNVLREEIGRKVLTGHRLTLVYCSYSGISQLVWCQLSGVCVGGGGGGGRGGERGVYLVWKCSHGMCKCFSPAKINIFLL